MSRVERLIVSLVLLLRCSVLLADDGSAGATSYRQVGPPNIVVILADDLGWADLGEGSRIDTPHLNQFASEGLVLSRFYASAPICSPTRAALLTGRYPHSVGVPELVNATARSGIPKLSLDHSATTIPEALKPAGYRSILVGKWHLGYDRADWPRTHGFDEFWGSLCGTPGYYDVQQAYHNESPTEVHGYYTDQITDRAVAYLRAQDGRQPLFLYVAFNAPHYPLEAPAELVYKYRSRYKDGLFAIYAAMTERLDSGIGRILMTLDELGMRDNTLVVFMSDNGPSAEPKSYGPSGADISNGPLRGWKFSTFEGGIRVPFIARWPGHIAAGSERDEVAVTMDLLPTLLDAASIRRAAEHEMDGESLMPLLAGEPFARTRSLHWETRRNLAVVNGNWKLVHQFWSAPQLFNLESDISEEHDLAEKYPDMVNELMQLHATWKAQHYPDPLPHITVRDHYQFPDWPDAP